MFDRAQLRKGTLEGCILKIIAREPAYGYAIATILRESGFADLTEGTLYPLLLRLERKGLIRARRPQPQILHPDARRAAISGGIHGGMAGNGRQHRHHFARVDSFKNRFVSGLKGCDGPCYSRINIRSSKKPMT